MSKQIIAILSDSYPKVEFHLMSTNYGGQIHAFFIKIGTVDMLELSWEGIRNTIGVYFQSKLESDFSVWNIYLFFIIPQPLSKSLKHKIEHDIISSRKIVIDGNNKMNDKDFYTFLFEEHISNNNLIISVGTEIVNQFKKDNTISQLVDAIDFSKVKKNKEEVFGEILTQLEKNLKK